MTDHPTTEAGRRAMRHFAPPGNPATVGPMLAQIEIEARAEALDDRLYIAVLKFYADQLPAFAASSRLNREEYAAVMVDVKRVRAVLAAKADR